jgi:hypothetical protein
MAVAYTGGTFDGEGSAVDCLAPSGWMMSIYNHSSVAGTLSWAGIAMSPVSVPFDIGPCVFNPTGASVSSSDFTVTILDDGASGTVGSITVTVVASQ